MSTESVTAANTGDSGIGPLARQTRRDLAVAAEQLVSGWKQATTAMTECQAKRDVVAVAIERARTDFKQKFPELMATEPSATASGERWDYLVTRQHDGRWSLRADVQKTLESTSGAISSALYPYKKGWWQSKGTLMKNATPHIDRFWRTVRGMELERDRLAAELDQLTERRTTDAQTSASRATAHLQASSRALLDAQRHLADVMAPWLSASWGRWTPPPAPSEAVYLGATKLRPGQVPPPNERFGLDLSLPVFASVRTGLHVIHDRSSRSSAHGLARSLIFRALAATPPGKLRLSIFDPLGLGQSVASILELAEFDRDLLGGKVWSSSDDLRHLLGTHVAHTELVIQKYLRAEFSTLDAFNVAAGEIAEPYRLFVVFDAPERIDEPSFAELRRIVENGPRCGIATLLVSDTSAAARHGVDMSLLPDSFPTMRISAPISEAINNEHVLFDFVPETDELVSPEVTKSIIHLVGLGARESISSAVSFERVFGLFNDAALDGRNRGLPQISARIEATDSSSWWSQTTVESVAAPIGLRGARDVAALMFDSSDHSGALLVGRPGSGKSTLLHTFIGGITTMYGPRELELHLIDFKEGVEFKVYGANSLPHARTVAIESDREFGVSVLQAIQAELTWRGSLLRGSTESHSSLEALRKATGERLPRIVLIFDEFQVLFARNDKLGAVAAEALETLIRQGRGFGIHVLLGSQSLSGLDALGSHVPQLLPVRILLPATDSDVFKVLGEGNTEGTALTTAGEGILNMAGGVVEANERFRGAVIDDEARRSRVTAMRAKADAEGFNRRPVVFEGNAPIPAEDTPPPQFVDEIRGADARTLRLRFGAPMAIAGSADINLHRESGANVLLVARDAPSDTGTFDPFSLPRAVTANVTLSAVAQRASVQIVDFLPIDEGLDTFFAPLLEATAVNVSRRRQVPDLLKRIRAEVKRRVDEDDTSGPATFLVLYGLHRARDFDQDSVDYDREAELPELLSQIMRDGPEVGVHTFLWFDTVASISRRLPSSAVRELSWRLAGKMSADDSSSFAGVDGASSLREQQLLAANEDRGILQRCTSIAEPSREWTQALLADIQDKPKEPTS